MPKLNLEQVKAVAKSYIDSTKIAVNTFTAAVTNTAGLVDKIGRIVSFDTTFIDDLSFMDGEPLELGKTIEEWQEDLILPQPFDATGANALAPTNPSYRPVSYSYNLGEKTFKITLRQNDVNRGVLNSEQLANIVATRTKKLYDSRAVWKKAAKRQLLGEYAGRAVTAIDVTGLTAASASAAAVVGTRYKHGSPAVAYLCVKPYTASAEASVDKMIENGYLIKMETAQDIAVPVDTQTGEAFIEQVKKDVEIAKDESEGYSLNGNTLGSYEGMVLLVRKGIMPNIEVQVQAGAFNGDKIAMPVEVKVVKDFGSDTKGIFAVLMDARGAKLCSNWDSVMEQVNAEGAFANIFLHTGNTAHLSNNTFIKAYYHA